MHRIAYCPFSAQLGTRTSSQGAAQSALVSHMVHVEFSTVCCEPPDSRLCDTSKRHSHLRNLSLLGDFLTRSSSHDLLSLKHSSWLTRSKDGPQLLWYRLKRREIQTPTFEQYLKSCVEAHAEATSLAHQIGSGCT